MYSACTLYLRLVGFAARPIMQFVPRTFNGKVGGIRMGPLGRRKTTTCVKYARKAFSLSRLKTRLGQAGSSAYCPLPRDLTNETHRHMSLGPRYAVHTRGRYRIDPSPEKAARGTHGSRASWDQVSSAKYRLHRKVASLSALHDRATDTVYRRPQAAVKVAR